MNAPCPLCLHLSSVKFRDRDASTSLARSFPACRQRSVLASPSLNFTEEDLRHRGHRAFHRDRNGPSSAAAQRGLRLTRSSSPASRKSAATLFAPASRNAATDWPVIMPTV